MISSLTGSVQTIHPNAIVLDVNGVGYFVNVTPALAASVELGSRLLIQTAMIVREDAMTLFGFADQAQLSLFELLRSVSGVGPKSALAICSSLNTDQIFDAVSSEDDLVFKAVPGIGPKTAKLIVVTLAGKVSLSGNKTQSSAPQETVVAALIGLGYNEKAARAAVGSASASSSTQELLRAALAALSSTGKAD